MNWHSAPLSAFMLAFVSLVIISCEEKRNNPYEHISLAQFEELKTADYALNSHQIREHLARLTRQDNDSAQADFRVRAYYRAHRPFIWIDRQGLDGRADTLVSHLSRLGSMGFGPEKFRIAQIERDMRRIRTLDLPDSTGDINRVMARLEYNLTKAYLRYVYGQRFGFVNPSKILNHYDVKDSDSVRVVYYQLYDLKTDHPGEHFYEMALRKVVVDSVDKFLNEVEPRSSLYKLLMERLNTSGVTASERVRLLCNMERCRWRTGVRPEECEKYVLVNIPSFKLRAVCPDSTMEMRVGCGTYKTKTPLIHSHIHRMDLNPQWIVPRSIIEKDIIRHVGNAAYFQRQHMFVKHRKSGKKVEPENITWSMLNDKNYLVVQEGGVGNSLGRIIFRFDNNFSIYLHDTSSRGFFGRDVRSVSHGCVRVERPYELALFLMGRKDDELAEKIRYSMTADVGSHDELPEEERPILEQEKIVHSLSVKPEVPVFICYYTVFPSIDGRLESFPDVYGYDNIIYKELRRYIE